MPLSRLSDAGLSRSAYLPKCVIINGSSVIGSVLTHLPVIGRELSRDLYATPPITAEATPLSGANYTTNSDVYCLLY